jgi:hypothetical protein
MWIIEEREAKHWLSQRGLLDASGNLAFSRFVRVIRFSIPADSGRKTALSRQIVSLFSADEEALLWINEFGIWPSSEDRNLFKHFRESLGEASSLQNKPAHIFRRSELDDVASLLGMVLFFFWGAVMYSPARGLLVEISHDEYVVIHARNLDDTSDVVEALEPFSEEAS